MSDLAIVTRAADPAAYERLLGARYDPDPDGEPQSGEFARLYYPRVYGDALEDLSFAVTTARGARPLALVECDVTHGVLCRYGFPMQVRLAAGVEGESAARAITRCFAHLDAIAGERAVQAVRVLDRAPGPDLSPVGEACLARRGLPRLRLEACTDLSATDDALRRDVRKSFRSLLNWGERNLRLAFVNRDNPDRTLFDEYQAFHHRVAGRVTRSQASWEAMFEWVSRGRGELVLGYWQEAGLVSAALVVDGAHTAFYASGVYDRALFDKPLAHWPLFLAMLRSRQRGMRYFNLGEIPAYGTVSEKEYNIGYFKKGFTSRLRTAIVWELSQAQAEPRGQDPSHGGRQ